MRKVILLTLVLLLTFTTMGFAAEVSGSLDSHLTVDIDEEELDGKTEFNLIIEDDFGFDADMKVDLGFLLHENYENEVRINEAYLNYYTMNSDWRLGKQEINWGSGYKLNPTSYFNPQNLKAFDLIDENLAVRAVKSTYYTAGGLEISGVVAPFFKGNGDLEETEKIADKFAKELSTEKLSFDDSANDIENELSDIQAGAKLTNRGFKGYDISLSAYHGYDLLPSMIGADNDENLLLEYPEVNKLGFDLIGDVKDIGIWSEIVYNIYSEDYYDDTLNLVVGADYNFDNDLYLVGQFYYRGERVEQEPEIQALNLYFSKPAFDFHEVEFTTLYDLESGSYMIKPQYNHSLVDSIELQLGAKIVDIDIDDELEGFSFGDSLGSNSIYTRLNVNF
ncbi:hypothetical protein [Natroniella sp. ANB-PHB2]|uniref:hypothetical protein n=1 Tax=Natroniella sp. ANB-PHB2 TaxID=3384444 RepID=UPI0038D4DF5F